MAISIRDIIRSELPRGYTGSSGTGGMVAIGDSAPPTGNNGALWFNSDEARGYVEYNNTWVELSPTVLPQPEQNPEVKTITFDDNTVQTTAYTPPP